MTVVVPKALQSCVVPEAHCFLPCVAIRVPNHPIAQRIISEVGPLAAPSANLSGALSPTTAEHVVYAFNKSIPVLDGGACTVGVESTILDLRQFPFRVIRSGFWSLERLKKIFPHHEFCETSTLEITTPGSSLHHYAPNKPLVINVSPPFSSDMGIVAFGPCLEAISEDRLVQLSWDKNLEEAARNLFSALHYLDRSKVCARIGVVPIPNYGIGRAIIDRLTRAAYVP